jgi:hypothetical protein
MNQALYAHMNNKRKMKNKQTNKQKNKNVGLVPLSPFSSIANLCLP